MHSRLLLVSCLTVFLSACGSDGANCDQPLTVSSVNNEVQTEPLFVQSGVTVSGTSLVHEDGDQGNTVDLLSLVLARSTHPDGNSLLVAFSAKNNSVQSDDTYFALYIDTDNDPNTGEDIDGLIGADSVILDDARAFGGLSLPFSHYHTWTGAWTAQPLLNSSVSVGSYFEGCTEVSAMFIPLSMGVTDLSGLTNVKGIMKVIKLQNGDPDFVTAVVDTSTVFTFDVP